MLHVSTARRLALLAALLAAAPALAQRGGVTAGTPLRPVTRAAAIVGARVVTAPGRVTERATVLIRDGRIEAVGQGLRVPPDADVLAADSFTVYAGFVDALGTEGVPTPPDAERPDDLNRGEPPRALAGILPDRDVRDLYDPAEARVRQFREAGFGAAHVAPPDGLFSGQGAVVLLRAPGRGESARDVVLRGPVSVVARLTPARGVYPSTVMGVAAVVRSSFENVRRYRALGAQGARVPYDPSLDALGPVLSGEQRLVLVAEAPLDAFRALGLARDVRVAPILAGLTDAAPLAGRLAETRTAVFAPLALPDTVALDSLARGVALVPSSGVASVSDRRTRSALDLPAERAALAAERREAVRRREASPAALDAAGVEFAFATLGVDAADVLPNVRRMVRAGLPRDAALAALTTAPARLLGEADRLGTVEPGRIANLVLTTGDLFADSSRVRYVFVEGARTDVAAARARRGASDSTGVAGTWAISVVTPGQEQTGTFTLTGEPGSLAGTTDFDGETYPLSDVRLDGDWLSFTFTVGGLGTVRVSGAVAGDAFSGTAEVGALGSFPATATRTPE